MPTNTSNRIRVDVPPTLYNKIDRLTTDRDSAEIVIEPPNTDNTPFHTFYADIASKINLMLMRKGSSRRFDTLSADTYANRVRLYHFNPFTYEPKNSFRLPDSKEELGVDTLAKIYRVILCLAEPKPQETYAGISISNPRVPVIRDITYGQLLVMDAHNSVSLTQIEDGWTLFQGYYESKLEL